MLIVFMHVYYLHQFYFDSKLISTENVSYVCLSETFIPKNAFRCAFNMYKNTFFFNWIYEIEIINMKYSNVSEEKKQGLKWK